MKIQIDREPVEIAAGETWIVQTRLNSDPNSGAEWSQPRAVTITRLGEKTISLGSPGNGINGSEPTYFYENVIFIERYN